MRFTNTATVIGAILVSCAITYGANGAECTKIAAAGDGLTTGIATLMSKNGLANIIEGRGLKPSGPVQTKCEAGTIMVECKSSQTACK